MLDLKSRLEPLGIEEFRLIGHNLEVYSSVVLNTEQSSLLGELPLNIKFLNSSDIEDIYKNIKLMTPFYSSSKVRENFSDLVIKGHDLDSSMLVLLGDRVVTLKDTKVFGSTLGVKYLNFNGLTVEGGSFYTDACTLRELKFHGVCCKFEKTSIAKGVFKDCLTVRLDCEIVSEEVRLDITVDNTDTFILFGSYSGIIDLKNIEDTSLDFRHSKNKLDISGSVKNLEVCGVKSKAELKELCPNLEFKRMKISKTKYLA